MGLGSQKVTNFIYFCKFRGVNFTGLGLIKVTNFIFILHVKFQLEVEAHVKRFS